MSLLPRPLVSSVLAVLLAAGSANAADGSFDRAKLRKEALRLFGRGAYEEACPLFERLVKETPNDAQTWADLGLCEWKRGRVAESTHASLEAFRLGDARVRKAAIFNLHQAGFRTQLPEPGARLDTPRCTDLQPHAEFTCGTPLWACAFEWSQYGSGGGTSGIQVVFGRDAQARRELETEKDDSSSVDDPNSLMLLLEEEWLCGWCLAHAWDCTNSKVVLERVDRCFRERAKLEGKVPSVCDRKTPEDSRLCDIYSGCFDELCGRAQKAFDEDRSLWPQAADEIARARKRCDTCGTQYSIECEVIAVDPCAGRVGYVCSAETRASKKPTREVRELQLTPAEP